MKMSCAMCSRSVSLLTRCGAAALVLAAGSASAAIINVPADQPTIQAAINAAAQGDTVIIAPGTYVEKIDLQGKAITIRGGGAPAETIIDGGGTPGFVVRIDSNEGANTIIENLTVTGAKGADSPFTSNTASAIKIHNASPRLRKLIIRDNYSGIGGNGAGIHAKGGSPVITQVMFSNNEGSILGGAAYFEASKPTIAESIFMNNMGRSSGGGGIAANGGSLTLLDSWFEGNLTNSFGGAIYANGSTLTLQRLSLVNNGWAEKMPHGGMIYYTYAGGGIYAKDSRGRVESTFIDGNIGANGGGVYVAGTSANLSFVNCIATRNQAALGGGMLLNGASPAIVNCTVTSNNYGGLYTLVGSKPIVVNSIFAGHSVANLPGADIFGAGEAHVSYSLLQGQILNGVKVGPGVIQGPAGLDDNFVPLPGSLAIDAGDSSKVPSGVTTDFFGLQRIVDDPATADSGLGTTVVDLGAAEFQPGGSGIVCDADIDRSGFVDTDDFDAYVMIFSMGVEDADFDASGFVDTEDFDAFVRAYQNGC